MGGGESDSGQGLIGCPVRAIPVSAGANLITVFKCKKTADSVDFSEEFWYITCS